MNVKMENVKNLKMEHVKTIIKVNNETRFAIHCIDHKYTFSADNIHLFHKATSIRLNPLEQLEMKQTSVTENWSSTFN